MMKKINGQLIDWKK